MRVVVVGAGLAGLSAACHLRGDGHDVTVLEAGGQPGGRAGMWEVAGYRLDTGPTVLTMPDLLAAVFASVGQRLEDYVTLIRLDPAYRACFADGSEIRVRSGRAAMTAEIAALCNERDAAAFEGFCDWLAGLYRLEFPHFIDRNFDSPLDLARDVGAVMGLLRAGGFGKLQHRVEATFQDPRLHRLFAFQALYAGLSPFEALALYGVITYMDTVAGVYTAQGGMHAVPVALAAAATRAGVTFRYWAEVCGLRATLPARSAASSWPTVNASLQTLLS